MPCSSSRSAIVAMSDHPRAQWLGVLLRAGLFPAFLMQPGHRLLDMLCRGAAASDEAAVIRRRSDHQRRVNSTPYRCQEFFARGLFRIVVTGTRMASTPECV